jgi:hypothetical protein
VLEQVGQGVGVLKVKKPPLAEQAIHNIAKTEWEKMPGRPRIDWHKGKSGHGRY